MTGIMRSGIRSGDITTFVRYLVRLVLRKMTADIWKSHGIEILRLNNMLNTVVGRGPIPAIYVQERLPLLSHMRCGRSSSGWSQRQGVR